MSSAGILCAATALCLGMEGRHMMALDPKVAEARLLLVMTEGLPSKARRGKLLADLASDRKVSVGPPPFSARRFEARMQLWHFC